MTALLVSVVASLLLTQGCGAHSTAASDARSWEWIQRLPLRRPTDLLARTNAPWVWSPILTPLGVAYVESEALYTPGGLPPAEVPGSIKIATPKEAVEVGPDVQVPQFGAAVLWPPWKLFAFDSLSGELLLFSTTVDPTDIDPTVPVYRGLSATALRHGGVEQSLAAETTCSPFVTGDVLVVPFTEEDKGDSVMKLGMLTAQSAQLVEVDERDPVLPSASLAGISPYCCLFELSRGGLWPELSSLRDDLPGDPPRVFDLGTGRLVDIAVVDAPDLIHQVTQVELAGNWAAWVSTEGDPVRRSLYLADLQEGTAARVFSEPDGGGGSRLGSVALGQNWLVWLDVSSGALVGFSLPDLTSFAIKGAKGEGERVRGLQVAGDLALLEVHYGGPEVNLPDRVRAVRLIRLR